MRASAEGGGAWPLGRSGAVECLLVLTQCYVVLSPGAYTKCSRRDVYDSLTGAWYDVRAPTLPCRQARELEGCTLYRVGLQYPCVLAARGRCAMTVVHSSCVRPLLHPSQLRVHGAVLK